MIDLVFKALLIFFLSIYPIDIFAHHISSSASNWTLSIDSASVDFQYPLADSAILVSPDYVEKGETYVQLIKPVDDDLRGKITKFLNDEIPTKIILADCSYVMPLEIRYTDTKIFAHGELKCAPGYLDNLRLEDRFLVSVNNLHVAVATLTVGEDKYKCLFRTGLHTCEPASATAKSDEPIPWKEIMGGGNVLVFRVWEQFCFLILILLAASNAGSGLKYLGLFAIGNAAGLIPLMWGKLPEPSQIKALVPLILIYGAAALFKRRGVWSLRAWFVFWAMAGVLMTLGIAEIAATPPAAIAGITLLGYGMLASSDDDAGKYANWDFYIFSSILGLLHGFEAAQGVRSFSTLGAGGLFAAVGFDPSSEKLKYAAMLISLAIIAVAKRRLKSDRWILAAAAPIAIASGYWLISRGMALPGFAMNYRESVKTLEEIIRAPIFSPKLLLVSMILALALGALHALTPGHGKTVVAAYLVGSKGRVTDAMLLGLTVTITHTSSVLLLGLIALAASKTILPGDLTPYLGSLSGGIIIVMGVVMFASRYRNWRRTGEAVPTHVHDFDGHHNHDHAHHENHTHDHHSHHHGAKSGVRLLDLITLGISGGMVPCPDAFVVLLIAVAVNRIALGIAVILVFSVGMAAVLIAIGIMMVKARPLVEKFGGGGFIRVYMPFASAILVTMLGIAITYQAATKL